MDEKLFIFIAIILISFLIIHSRLTGYVIVSVEVLPYKDVKQMLNFERVINYSQTQKITLEIMNSGNLELNESTTLSIYKLDKTLKKIVEYQKPSSSLKPMEISYFNIYYFPTEEGTYYIKVRTNFDGKIKETWAVFWVVIPVRYEVVQEKAPPAPPMPFARLEVEYEKNITMYQNETKLISLILNNTGNVPLGNINFYVSLDSSFEFEINPKVIFNLQENSSQIVLLTLNASKVLPGHYPLEIEIVSDLVRRRIEIDVNVLPSVPVKLIDLEVLKQEILKYQYLIFRFETQILELFKEGYDISKVNITLQSAKIQVEKEKENFENEKYDAVIKNLDEARKLLENLAFDLANLRLWIVITPSYINYWLILIVILIILITYYEFRKRTQKPIALRGVE
jgi:hypothetical protein